VADELRALPSVDRLAAEVAAADDHRYPPTSREAIAAARAVLTARRTELLAGRDGDPDLVARALAWLQPRLGRVLNATGVVLHTNLGRAPLAVTAAEATLKAGVGYVDLELDLATGRRGHRDVHAAALLTELTGAQDAIVVNNGAGATLLAAAALAGPGKAIVVSRGQLVEIGGGFRIPDVVAQAGARLVEVGTTNRTRLADVRRALDEGADVVLRVHQSNFRTVGFVEDVGVEELCTLGAPVIDDLGSGVLAPELAPFADEPSVRASVDAGADLVLFSGDKLLGGPQAGLLVGRAEAIAACRRHPLMRALRVGRLPLAALIATLALYRDPERARREIPVLAMLTAGEAELHERAQRLAQMTRGELVAVTSRAGGGALPLLDLPGPGVALPGEPDRLAALLRAQDPPLIARITDGRLVLDPRTLAPHELDEAAIVARAALCAL